MTHRMGMKMIDKMLEGMFAVASETIYVTPVHEVEYTEPRYKHWWDGWLEFGRSELPEAITLGMQLLGRWPEPEDRSWVRRGPRLRKLYVTETHWDSNGEDDWSRDETHFCGWDELLHPVNKRRRDVEKPFPVPAQVEANFHGLKLVGDMSWVAHPKGSLPPGDYHKVRVRNADGELLFESSLRYTCHIEENYTFNLTDVTVTLSW